MKTMMALRAHERGGPDKLIYEQAPVPAPGPGDVLVAVRAAAITFAELGWELSWTTRDGADRTPVIPSHELAGDVVALGRDVTSVAVGDEVFGMIDFDRNGAAAEFAVTRADEIARRPRSVTYTQAAALPLAALTAWQALVDQARLKEGERLLVHGGAGGVGAYAVQIGVLLGASVTATALPKDVAFVQELGAGEAIDFTTQRFEDFVVDVDVVLDTVGRETLRRSFDVARGGGRVVTLPAPAPAGLGFDRDVAGLFFVVRPDAAELAHLAALVEKGEIRPIVSQVFPLANGRAAYESAGRSMPPGKTVLEVQPA